MTDNSIEHQDYDFFHNAANELINRDNNNGNRLHTLINELMRIPTLTTPFNSVNHTTPNTPYDIFFGSEFEYEIMSNMTGTPSHVINTLNNDISLYKKVLSSEGEKSLKKIKYDKTKVEYDKCPILQTDFEPEEEITQLPCKHCFNTVAIERWLKEEKSECPVCRHKLEHVEKKINIDEEYNTDEETTGEETTGEETTGEDTTYEDTTYEETTDEDTTYEDTTYEDTTYEDTTYEDTVYNDINTDITSINLDYNFPVFNLINSLHRTSNLNNRNYYISTNEEDELQEAIRLSLVN